MINRRFLRIKVMQALYGFFQSEKSDLPKTEKELMQTLDKVYDLYIYLFAILADIHHVANLSMEDGRNKHLPSEQDLNPNKKFVDNVILNGLANNASLNREITNRKISWQNDMDLIRKLYADIRSSEEYKKYMSIEKNSVGEDKQFLLDVIRNVIADHELLNYWFEDRSIHWADDIYIGITALLKTVEQADSSGKITLSPLYREPDEDKQFARDLLSKCVVFNETLEGMISLKTQNWEIERIAVLDVLLMKMALTEVLHFQNIPIKVSLNEYIELSKEYSTPKSKVFINGVLDKIVIDLKTEGKVNKTGRGLME
jgi:N utilization substance protein B